MGLQLGSSRLLSWEGFPIGCVTLISSWFIPAAVSDSSFPREGSGPFHLHLCLTQGADGGWALGSGLHLKSFPEGVTVTLEWPLTGFLLSSNKCVLRLGPGAPAWGVAVPVRISQLPANEGGYISLSSLSTWQRLSGESEQLEPKGGLEMWRRRQNWEKDKTHFCFCLLPQIAPPLPMRREAQVPPPPPPKARKSGVLSSEPGSQ